LILLGFELCLFYPRTIDCRSVSSEEARAYAEKLNIPFLETSAKNSDNVEQAFLTMATELIKIRQARGNGGGGSVDLKKNKGKSSKGCC